MFKIVHFEFFLEFQIFFLMSSAKGQAYLIKMFLNTFPTYFHWKILNTLFIISKQLKI